jgi:succinate dehydrogenase/fumarate reductase flavoprotein subunit
MKPYDLIVIGSGPGGQRAAIQGAKAGKGVAVIAWYHSEQDHARSCPAPIRILFQEFLWRQSYGG